MKELIREYPELGELLAEFENRISCLELSTPNSVHREKAPVQETNTAQLAKLKDDLDQLKGQFLYLQKKFFEKKENQQGAKIEI